jgi:hypothetical protein
VSRRGLDKGGVGAFLTSCSTSPCENWDGLAPGNMWEGLNVVVIGLFLKYCIAGVRPFRNGSYRLEAETIGSKFIVHNYGHGGAGITLSWGCAAKGRRSCENAGDVLARHKGCRVGRRRHGDDGRIPAA